MKSIITKCLSFVFIIAMLIYVLCFGSAASALVASQNVIRITVDGDTFIDYQIMYCMIYDETADENVSSWMSNNTEMTRDGDTDTWSYDLDAHEITLYPSHCYTVTFFSDTALTDELVIEGYDSSKDYTAVFTELYTYKAFTEIPKYLYKWIGENEFDIGMDIIRINADKNTFWQPIDSLYCHIVDETAYENVIEMGRMTKEADSDIWCFDLGKHGVSLDSAHTYTVTFHDGRAESTALTIDDYNSDNNYTAVFTGKYIYDEIVDMSRSEYKWSNDNNILYGDADCDGEVTILDVTAIQRYDAGMNCQPFNEKAADVDGKGLDIIDAALIRRFLADMIDRFPVEYKLT